MWDNGTDSSPGLGLSYVQRLLSRWLGTAVLALPVNVEDRENIYVYIPGANLLHPGGYPALGIKEVLAEAGKG